MENNNKNIDFKLQETIHSNYQIVRKIICYNHKGSFWLIAQLIIFFAHLLPPFPVLFIWNSFIKSFFIIFLIIGIYKTCKALLSLGRNLSPFPDPKENTILITEGSYKYCRHPLYQAMIIISLSYSFYLGSLLHLFLSSLLVVTLIGKAKREERKLKLKYEQYSNYLIKTPAIFDGIRFLDWRN